MVSVDDLQNRRTLPHSYRNYSPEMFREAWDTADAEEKRSVRVQFRRMESGRFHEMLDATHKMFTALDPDEKETFVGHNPRLVQWMHVYALIEEQNPFSDFIPD